MNYLYLYKEYENFIYLNVIRDTIIETKCLIITTFKNRVCEYLNQNEIKMYLNIGC